MNERNKFEKQPDLIHLFSANPIEIIFFEHFSYKQELIKKERENLQKLDKELLESNQSSSGRGKSTEDTDVASTEESNTKKTSLEDT